MLNEIYKQQYLRQTGQDATSKKRKREEAIETINTFIEECQTSQQYTLEMKRRKNNINNKIRERNHQLQTAKNDFKNDFKNEAFNVRHFFSDKRIVNNQRKRYLNKIIGEHERVIDDLKSQENNLVDEVNNKCAFHVPLGVIIAIRELVNDSI